jgi:glycerophosphoryl diester phosphodiesterase
MELNQITLSLAVIFLMAAPVISQNTMAVHGHRGAKGLMPENTIPGFLKAVEYGVDAIEMDVVVSADQQLVLSHEPWISSLTCLDTNGISMPRSKEKHLILYKMKYTDIQAHDCGMLPDPEFPHQLKISAVKPTLKMVVRTVQQFARDNQYRQPSFSIELKSDPKRYDLFYPKPAVFADLIVNEIRRLGIEENTLLLSTDILLLEHLYKVSSRKFKIGYVVEKGKDVEKNMSRLSFVPDIYSPDFQLLDITSVEKAHAMNMKVVAWTINEPADAMRLKSMGVDAIVTDYPDAIMALLNSNK